MVQINKLVPFKLKNFNTMIKTYVIGLIVALFLFFLLDENVQKNRMLVLILFYFILFIMVSIGRKVYINKTNEKLGLYLLYISTLFFPLGFLLLEFASDTSISLKKLLSNMSIMLFIAILLISIFILCKKYGIKYFSDNILIYIIILPSLIIMVISLMIMNENIVIMFIGFGACMVYGFAIQYERISIYFEQKNTNRYGESLDILSNLKEKKKK